MPAVANRARVVVVSKDDECFPREEETGNSQHKARTVVVEVPKLVLLMLLVLPS